jgi:hypothetical protein
MKCIQSSSASLCSRGLGIRTGRSGSRPPHRAEQTITKISDSAARELEKSTAELNALREQIAAEKLPLAQEVTALESF